MHCFGGISSLLGKTNPLSPKVFWVTFGLQNPHDHRSVIHGDLKFLPCMTIMFIELDDGNILTGKPNQFDGKKTHGFSGLRFSLKPIH